MRSLRCFDVASFFAVSSGDDASPAVAAARVQAAEAKIHEIEAKLEVYRVYGGSYPTTSQGIRALVVKPGTKPLPRRWEQQFTTLPVDPWGSEYVYVFDPATGTYTLGSKGPDGVAGTADDL